MRDTVKLTVENKPLMVGHQGLLGLERGNTHGAFIAAGNRSYAGIETDIHRTADGRFVCIHDANTKSVAIDSVNVEECTFDTVRKIQLCGLDGKKSRADICIPSVEEYIGICKHYNKYAVAEIKGLWTKEHIVELCEVIATEGWFHKTIFIAFDLQNLLWLRELCPIQTAQYLVGAPDESLPETLDRYNLDLDIYFESLTPELCERVHAGGHKVNVWTVDKLEDAERLAAMGVDYITSNIIE